MADLLIYGRPLGKKVVEILKRYEHSFLLASLEFKFSFFQLAVKVPRCTSLGSDSLVKLRKVKHVSLPRTAVLIFTITNQRLIQECYVRSAATHPNITPFLGISFDFDRPGVPCLVSPYYQHGDITSYLKEHPHINKLPLVSHDIG